ncbi:hypothetical protein ACFSR9_05875 [Deinococcus taklimakanensis]|uniref:Uncharacterized protein n=1 Tax=Deinococcus taklimakanensis TaxID=536443 RepID=A0ABW5P252_9DEIO
MDTAITDTAQGETVQEQRRGITTSTPGGVNFRSRRLAGTVSLRFLFPVLTADEYATFIHASRPMLGRELADVQPGELPEPLRPGQGVQRRLGALAVPAGSAEHLALLPSKLRARYIRAALARVAREHTRGRWFLSFDTQPATTVPRERISVGTDRWVARAIWRRSDGSPRTGNSPNTPLYASAGQLPTHAPEDPYADYINSKLELFEVLDARWGVEQVFGARSLDDAARQVITGEQTAIAPPGRLRQPRAAEYRQRQKKRTSTTD